MTARLKVSVVTITWRPGYIDTMAAALCAQTMSKDSFEWVLVDDLWEMRRDAVAAHVNGAIRLVHVPPREITRESGTGIAVNTGLAHASGELVYFMPDYCYPSPRSLERHWEIYTRFGPQAIIVSPWVDRITQRRESVWLGASAPLVEIQVGARRITFPDHSPPVEIALRPGYDKPSPDNFISIFADPVRPLWRDDLTLDWRMGWLLTGDEVHTPVPHGRGLFEIFSPGRVNWWYGRGDSAPRTALLESGGLPERTGTHGGLETLLTRRLLDMGCRFFADHTAPVMILPHPSRKPERNLYPSALAIQDS